MKGFLFLCLFFLWVRSQAQELFPSIEPASTLPKGIWAGRVIFRNFAEFDQPRNYYALRAMYGITPKLTASLTASVSNHHLKKYPGDLNNYFLNHHTPTGVKKYPYQFEGLNLYAQYRFYSLDGKNRHFRMAAYGEASKSFAAHDEAEPYLSADNTGMGAGLIVTRLVNKLAVSASVSYIHPLAYRERDRNLRVLSGDAFSWGLQFGYLAFPRKYKSYDDLNINLYLEILGKNFGGATVRENDKSFDTSRLFSLQAGSYVEVRPGVQLVINSKSRIDISVANSITGRSFLYIFPMLQVNYQKYFFK